MGAGARRRSLSAPTPVGIACILAPTLTGVGADLGRRRNRLAETAAGTVSMPLWRVNAARVEGGAKSHSHRFYDERDCDKIQWIPLRQHQSAVGG